MNPQFVSWNHFYYQHTKINQTQLKDEVLLGEITQIDDLPNSVDGTAVNSEGEDNIEEMEVDETTDDESERKMESEEQTPDITKMLANFFNELCNLKMVPVKTIR